MKEKPEAIQFADDRPMALDDDLYQWAIDAESLIRALQSRLESLENDNRHLNDGCAELEAQIKSLEKDAARWNMFVTICSEAIINPVNRKHQRCMDAYTLAIGKGLDCVGAIDAAMAAMQANKGE